MNDLKMKALAINVVLLIIIIPVHPASANDKASFEGLEITISSAKMLKGVAGKYITISGQVTNNSDRAIDDITTYL
jgi:hypothetical protein